MSLSSLADEEVANAQRRGSVTDYGAGLVAPRNLTTLNLRDRTASRGTTAAATVLDALARYVPTEIVTLYLTAISAMPALTATFAQVTDVRVYWFFAILTPILLLLVIAREAAARRTLSVSGMGRHVLVEAGGLDHRVQRVGARRAQHALSEQSVRKDRRGIRRSFVSTLLTLLEP